MIVVQWDLNKVSKEWLEARGWKYIKHVTENWVEMRLG
ncbi:hypothetical protein Clole_1203 [Cellulosilyticum lentocellum DSM 5427]|uniref:Uncharacterized protein n=1 Tax=Cellulosilyticum lentocellum (strain ATCC 49066 / DSM 5427 / NCIMB 11756 / RHM5) TaxID=642492 RepID=F2JGH7_CELLD|nr:hypothetical protein Clole_1203 [Cellulosilyticum lentocellum DSM 5427]